MRVSILTILISASGKTALLWSVTRPDIVAIAVCATAQGAAKNTDAAISSKGSSEESGRDAVKHAS